MFSALKCPKCHRSRAELWEVVHVKGALRFAFKCYLCDHVWHQDVTFKEIKEE